MTTTTSVALQKSFSGSSTSDEDAQSNAEEQESSSYPEGPLNTPLHAVAVNGNKALLQSFIHEACGNVEVINKGDRFGRTPLVYSVLGDRLDCAEILIKNGASVSLADVDGRTPLHWAAYQGNHKCIKLLLSKGANWKSKDTEGRTPLHFAASYHSSKCLNLLLKMASKGAVDDPDNNSMTALHWGASFGNNEHVKMLLKYRASVKLEDVEKKTPLHWAATNQNTSVVKLILEQSTEMINWRDTEGRTALHHAVAQQNEAVVRVLVMTESCNLSIQDNTYRSPLHWASVLGISKIVKLLLSKNADYTSSDGNGATALHYASQNDLAQTVEVFLSFTRVKDIPDNEGRTAIMWASGKGASAALETMLRHNLDVHATEKSGGTALHAAACAGHLKCVQLLLQHGASVNSLDMLNHTPIFRACETGHTDVVITLLQNGATLDLEDQDGRSPLHWAALGGHAHICHTLMKNGVQPDKKDRLGCTPLQCAAYGGFVNCMSVLIDYGADVNACDKEGISALHWSCSSGHLEAVKLLLKNRAFPNFMEVDGERLTPLDYAIFGDHQDVAQYMIEQSGLTITAIQEVAVTAIQSCWRGYRIRKPFQNRKNLYVRHEQLKKDLHMKKRASAVEEEKRRMRLANGGTSPVEEMSEEEKVTPVGRRSTPAVGSSAENVLNRREIIGESSRRAEQCHVPVTYRAARRDGVMETRESADSFSEDLEHSFPYECVGEEALRLSTIFEASLSNSQIQVHVKTTNTTENNTGRDSATGDVILEVPQTSENVTTEEKPVSEQIGKILEMTSEMNENTSRKTHRCLQEDGCDMSVGSNILKALKNGSSDGTNFGWIPQNEGVELEQEKISTKAQLARKERQRLNLIRAKVNAAVVIQRWFRRYRRDKLDRLKTQRAISEILLDQEELKHHVAALVIQLEWRKYVRRKLQRISKGEGTAINGVKEIENNITLNTNTPSVKQTAEHKQQPKSGKRVSDIRRTASDTFFRRSVFGPRISTATDSMQYRNLAPSPAALSYNLALDMYNPMSTRKSNGRASTPRRGANNNVKPSQRILSSARRTTSRWVQETNRMPRK